MRHVRFSGLAAIMQYAAALTAAVQRDGPGVIVINGDRHKIIPPRDPIPERESSEPFTPRVCGGQREKARRKRQMERAAAKHEAKTNGR